jgi:hypothetical protein
MDPTHAGYGTVSREHEYKAALRVFSETVRLSELRSMLGEPTHSHDLGDPVDRVGAVREHAHWGLESQIERTRPLDEHVELLVAFADSRRDELEALRPRCRSIDIFCGVFADPEAQGGWVFQTDLIRRLGDLQLPVLFGTSCTFRGWVSPSGKGWAEASE